MGQIQRFIPGPRLREVDHVDVGVPAARAYELVRHADLARSPLARALFSLRTLEAGSLRIDDITTDRRPGFRLLEDRCGEGFVVGAIGQVWHLDIPFIEVPPERFAAFEEPGFAKVAWEVRCEPRSEHASRIVLEVRVTTTDDGSWAKFRRYFVLIGPFSRLIRWDMLRRFRRELGTPEHEEELRPLPGDDIVPDALGQLTDAITIEAPPEAVWPWLVQMGANRGGFYSYDFLDNAGVPSARTIVPALQTLRVGDEIPATPRSGEGFVVRQLVPPRALVLSGTFDLASGHRVLPGEPRPTECFAMSWAFVLDPLEGGQTRLLTRVRGSFPRNLRGYLKTVPEVLAHPFMQAEQLRNLKRRAESVRTSP